MFRRLSICSQPHGKFHHPRGTCSDESVPSQVRKNIFAYVTSKIIFVTILALKSEEDLFEAKIME